MPHALIILAFCLLNLLPSAYARDGAVLRIEPLVNQGQLLLDADIDFTLSDELHDAARKGVPLYFTVDLKIQRPRWWWFDATVLTAEQTWRIQFNALTRQWRVGIGERSLPAATLDEALNLVRHVRGWAVGPARRLEAGVRYEGQLRLRLDTSRLARPFQIDALNSKTWSLSTPWKNFSFSLSADTPRE
ncbi:DUF4390 domain-containing protein [Castellaniella caeni]|uniref:DUF4390 domain-containing protein n=1 Tax=Castellaniella caeni TaxID=266123 RepID=UPI00082A2D8E|nr:DUF4390 domain-containing protein [Castellaniella caeni]